MSGVLQHEEWAKAVVDAAPTLDDEGKRMTIETFRLLARGEAITEAQIAEASRLSTERVEEAFRGWPLVLRDDDDRIVGFWGMYIYQVEPSHAVTVDGTTVFGWCAVDALFIPEILGSGAQVESADPTDGTPIRLAVTPDGVAGLDPPEAVVSFLLPDEGETFSDDAITRFCHQIYFFASPRSAKEWTADRPGTFYIPVDQAFALGKAINRGRLGTIPAPASDSGS